MLRLAPGSAATSGKRSLVLRSCKNAPLGKVIAAVGLPLASTGGAVMEVDGTTGKWCRVKPLHRPRRSLGDSDRAPVKIFSKTRELRFRNPVVGLYERSSRRRPGPAESK